MKIIDNKLVALFALVAVATAAHTASATSLTWMKSRDCKPSSYTCGRLPFSTRHANVATTPV